MAEEKTEIGAKPSKMPMILGLANTVLVLAAVGTLVYTKMVFKRQKITESTERTRIRAEQAKPSAPAVAGTMVFKPFTVNIQSQPEAPAPAEGTPTQLRGKLHYAHLSFTLEMRDVGRLEQIETLRPVMLDAILSLLGRKSFTDLTTIQGRYVLKTQILEICNRVAGSGSAAGPGVEVDFTNLHFNDLIVQ